MTYRHLKWFDPSFPPPARVEGAESTFLLLGKGSSPPSAGSSLLPKKVSAGWCHCWGGCPLCNPVVPVAPVLRGGGGGGPAPTPRQDLVNKMMNDRLEEDPDKRYAFTTPEDAPVLMAITEGWAGIADGSGFDEPGSGRYRECAFAIPVMRWERASASDVWSSDSAEPVGWYFPTLLLDEGCAIATGREVWGYNKCLAGFPIVKRDWLGFSRVRVQVNGWPDTSARAKSQIVRLVDAERVLPLGATVSALSSTPGGALVGSVVGAARSVVSTAFNAVGALIPTTPIGALATTLSDVFPATSPEFPHPEDSSKGVDRPLFAGLDMPIWNLKQVRDAESDKDVERAALSQIVGAVLSMSIPLPRWAVPPGGWNVRLSKGGPNHSHDLCKLLGLEEYPEVLGGTHVTYDAELPPGNVLL